MPTEKPTFEELVLEHAPFVRRTLAQMGVSARDLADVEQEVFRGADRGLPAFDPALSCNPDTAVRGWLFGICERQAASHRRAEIKRGEVLFATEELDYAASASPSVEDRLMDLERKALLERLLSSLEPHRRAVVVAYELEGVAMADVAAALSIPVNTAWNRLRLGREDLRAAWKRMSRQGGAGPGRVRDMPLLPLAALFKGASWCSEGGGPTGTLAEAMSESPASGGSSAAASAPVPAGQAAVGGGALPSAVLAPAQTLWFGGLAVGVPLAVTALLVLGAGEDHAALPDVDPRPVAAVMAPGPAAGVVLQAPPDTLGAGGPVLASVGMSALSVSGNAGHDLQHSDPTGGGTSTPSDVRHSTPAGPAASTGGAAIAPAGRPAIAPTPGSRELQRELKRIRDAAQALERGDLRAAQDELERHQQHHKNGHLAAERELLAVRALLIQGRRNEACDRVRAFLAQHPDSSARGQLEAMVARTK